MGEAIILFLIRHRIWVLAAAVVWAATGLWVVFQTPMDAVPDLSENQVLVYADWPGQSPPEIERRITRPLSQALQGLPGVRTIRGSSDVGSSLLHLIFEDAVSFAEARRRVSAQLASIHVEFPDGVMPRLAAEGIPTGQIYWYTVEGADTDLAELRHVQDHVVAPQLRSVPGVAEVASVGGFQAELHVLPDLHRLTALGVSVADLESALVAELQPEPGQIASTETAELLIRLAHNAPTPLRTADVGNSETEDCRNLENRILPLSDGRRIRLGDIAEVVIGTAPRRGVFEKDCNEAVAGIVHLRYGANPLEVTRAVRRRLQAITDTLPKGVRLVPCYDRTPLILGGVGTVTRTLLESVLITSLCVVLVLRHWRTSLVITLALPLAVLGAFLGMQGLRTLGLADVQTNIMSLAGIVISIGVLVDSSIVVSENVVHELRREFDDRPVSGDVSRSVAKACATVGIPAFFSVLIMLVSFLPVFALEGIDGRMYRPLAWTKSLALLSSALLTVTLVPVLCATFIRGRMPAESESGLVRSIVSVYRPALAFLLDRPLPLVVLLCITLIGGAAVTGSDFAVRSAAVGSVGICGWIATRWWSKVALGTLILLVALTAQSTMRPIGLALRLPLDEGMIMDMPITVPGITISQALDDLKGRNMVLCRFPEVQMATGKAGRAETPFDPAPLDMIETMVEFRPQSRWPSRRLLPADAERHAGRLVQELAQAGLIQPAPNPTALVAELVDAGMIRFDAVSREVCWQRLQAFQAELSRELALKLTAELGRRFHRAGLLTRGLTDAEVRGLVIDLPPADVRRLAQQPDAITVHVCRIELEFLLRNRGWLGKDLQAQNTLLSWRGWLSNGLGRIFSLEPVSLDDDLLGFLQSDIERAWSKQIRALNAELQHRAAATWTQIVAQELFLRQPILDDRLAAVCRQKLMARYGSGVPTSHDHGAGHTAMPSYSPLPLIDPHPAFDRLMQRLSEEFGRTVWLWPHDSESLCQAAGEMDRAVQMPGWANVWTRPIQNRVDMLATGVNSEIGIRVLGHNLDAVVQTSEDLARFLAGLPGAANVVADPVRGKSYLDVVIDDQRTRREGITESDLHQILSISGAGRVVARYDGRIAARPVRVKLPGSVEGPEGLLSLSIQRQAAPPGPGKAAALKSLPLSSVADVHWSDGPATIKSENGWLRNYVRLNVRDRDPGEFVSAAQRRVQQSFTLPPGVFLEWTGQYEHAVRTRRMIQWILPVVILSILAILYVSFRDFADAGLMILSVPGALAGGALCQWLLGFPFSIAVGVGYIACFGMAAATSVIMLVYLREAVERAGGLEHISLEELRAAVLSGAVHRLRPKLLTEATTILSLAPMLWSTGAGADVIRPMAAPVLGGLLIADECVDLLLPVAFYAARRLRWRTLRQSHTTITESVAQ